MKLEDIEKVLTALNGACVESDEYHQTRPRVLVEAVKIVETWKVEATARKEVHTAALLNLTRSQYQQD